MKYTLLDMLKSVVDISTITHIFYSDAQSLDIKTTFVLIDSMSYDAIDQIERISFWGKDFKVIVSRDRGYSGEDVFGFEVISFVKPRVGRQIKPRSLTEPVFSDAKQSYVLETQKQFDERAKREELARAERREQNIKDEIDRLESSLEKIHKTFSGLADLQEIDVPAYSIFAGGTFGECAYLVVPDDCQFESGFRFENEKVDHDLSRHVDYVGYAFLANGEIGGTMRHDVAALDSFVNSGETRQLSALCKKTRFDYINKCLAERKLVKVIGISSESSRIESPMRIAEKIAEQMQRRMKD